jgi:hypothetical protein
MAGPYPRIVNPRYYTRPDLSLHLFIRAEQFIAAQFHVALACTNPWPLYCDFLAVDYHRSRCRPPAFQRAVIAAAISRTGKPVHFIRHDQFEQLQLGLEQHMIDAVSKLLGDIG